MPLLEEGPLHGVDVDCPKAGRRLIVSVDEGETFQLYELVGDAYVFRGAADGPHDRVYCYLCDAEIQVEAVCQRCAMTEPSDEDRIEAACVHLDTAAGQFKQLRDSLGLVRKALT